MGTIKRLDDIQLTPDQREALKGMVDEAVNFKYKIDGYNDLIAETKVRAKDELGIPTKIFNKMVNAVHKDNARSMNEEVTAILDLLEEIDLYHHNEDDE